MCIETELVSISSFSKAISTYFVKSNVFKVSQKNEELEMLNASIDQMNRTWEEKVKALQRDVEKQKIKNQRLQSMIDVESNPQPK